MVSIPPKVYSLFANVDIISLATRFAAYQVPRLSTRVQRNTLDLKNCLLLLFSVFDCTALAVIVFFVLLLFSA